MKPSDKTARFSTAHYLRTFPQGGHSSKVSSQSPEAMTQQQFLVQVEQMRRFLVEETGGSFRDRLQYNECLNRAVLGYGKERALLLSMIRNELIRRRIDDSPPQGTGYASLAEALFAEIIGLNVLEVILKDREGIEEIQVIGKDIFIVRDGEAARSPLQFSSIQDMERIQQNLVLFNRDVLNPSKKWAEVSLSDGSRLTLTGFGYTSRPTITIRFYTAVYTNFEALCGPRYSTINHDIRLMLESLIAARMNMIIIGPTNSGKTQFMKSCIGAMPDEERLITIEPRYELYIGRDFPEKNVIEYETDEEDRRHTGRQAFKLSLRQSPKRICLAEIREEEANLYVRACTRGHDGSLTTVHASTLEDVPDVITDMCLLDGRNMNPERMRQRVVMYVTRIGIQMGMVRGRRKLMRMVEYDYSGGDVGVRELAVYQAETDQWHYPEKFSMGTAERIRNADRNVYVKLLGMGLISCS